MKHTGRGISAIEYPTGMNQNGDPLAVLDQDQAGRASRRLLGNLRHR